MRNFDLNIYEWVAYETSGEETVGYYAVAYEIPEEWSLYGSGVMHADTLMLSGSNVRYMRLEEEDEDFWIDSDSLRDEGRMPRRVARWLERLDAKA